MTDLTPFPITKKWPAQDPSVLQLYSFPTPNGVKVSIALEEMSIPYEAHKVTLSDADVKSPEFLSLNPNNKIPAIVDPNGPDGMTVGLFESGAILIYLAEKSGKFIGATATEKAQILQWLMFQMGGLGPMLGQLGFFYKFAGSEWEDKRPQERYITEAKRLLGVLERELAGKDWITGNYSIADMAIAPWLRALDFYGAKDVLGWDDHKNLVAYLDRFTTRPAVQTGLVTPPRD
ncbi:glutathione S-transferase family protein [Sulfitobacter geojensis]|uniref:Glutathione S-transferase N-terminal domain-containing protein n=1 Tax=Sulfitobacter geojensis TaxID=1342299 RepID=A0AAE2W0D5_9RHOB|nr:glutathione S-transferase N-terminal domain-containing protein [Sulfitobacter geojensis]MBM1690947.1 glutathione S-transferase N-terminal domain-containing protein [Sulfitobacter geojensis]MBM1695013.1 glutathione S-transferase N-terminal domain-containing protein [Sulfitobacter geojensis]MBM1707086.1 glutathione S-transferase N-terminal domain-containing protein [Sulfitobacter geojensis]MBM1711236.1 glutathione S-transferase N-terminal domain-containing protein [Sulfitobacter geojensis]MBM